MSNLQSPFKTILNFRDVGQTINDNIHKPLLQTGKLYRGARPDLASDDDRRRLREEFGVKTIVDLRTTTEHKQQEEKQQQMLSGPNSTPESKERADEPLRIPGIEYQNVNFNGWAYSKNLISKLSWLNTARLIGLMATGHRVEAIRILGENVMRERGLVGLALDSIDVCTSEVRKVFEILADANNYPVMLHCTQGKDRTGLTVLLSLLLVDAPQEAIQHDYMLSGPELLPEREERLKEIRSIGLSDDFADCDSTLIGKVSSHIEEKFGSVTDYLQHCGVTPEMQAAVRTQLSTSSSLDIQ